MILPTIPDVVSVDPMLTIARDLEGLGAKYRALITLVPPLPSRNGEMMREELDRAKIPVFRAMIRRTVLFGNAALEGKLISQLGDARAHQAWGDYESVGKEIEGLI